MNSQEEETDIVSAGESKPTNTIQHADSDDLSAESDTEDHFHDAVTSLPVDDDEASEGFTDEDSDSVEPLSEAGDREEETHVTEKETSETEKAEEEARIVEEEARIVEEESRLTEDERQERLMLAQETKGAGNYLFKQSCLDSAVEKYTEALTICPRCFHKQRSVMFSNRAACRLRQELHSDAISDCTEALKLDAGYVKALMRRAECYEKTEKLDEALEDYNGLLQLDPSLISAQQACRRLPEEINVRNEKMKEEMLGKLKELGNMVLKPFGLSTNNFQMQQDPQTGSYSMNFQQNPK